jgi:polar amino acid transport system substrate-binding protein
MLIQLWYLPGVVVRFLLFCGLLLAPFVAPAVTNVPVSTLTPPLRVVLEISPPHQTLQNGQVAGLTTTLVRQLLQQLPLDATFEVYPWARAVKIAGSTPNVMIYNIARTPEREALFHWIGPIAGYRLGFVRLKQRSDIHIRQLDDARPYSIAVQRDDFATEFLLKQQFKPGTQLQIQPDIEASWRMLLLGKADLLIDDPMAINAMLQKLRISSHEVEFAWFIPELAQTTWLALNRQSDPQLVKAMTQAYQQLQQDAVFVQGLEAAGVQPSEIKSD